MENSKALINFVKLSIQILVTIVILFMAVFCLYKGIEVPKFIAGLVGAVVGYWLK